MATSAYSEKNLVWMPELEMRDAATVGRLAFLMDAGGGVRVLDVRSGRILRTVATG